jgi:hypothetical protein
MVETMTDDEQREWEQAHLDAFGKLPDGAVMLDDTQGQVPDAFDEWARGFGDE